MNIQTVFYMSLLATIFISSIMCILFSAGGTYLAFRDMKKSEEKTQMEFDFTKLFLMLIIPLIFVGSTVASFIAVV